MVNLNSLPPCIAKLNLDFKKYPNDRIEIARVFDYIQKHAWKCMRPNTLISRRPNHPLDVIYLGKGRFCIDLQFILGEGSSMIVTESILYDSNEQTAELVANRKCRSLPEMLIEVEQINKVRNRLIPVRAICASKRGRTRSIIMEKYDATLEYVVGIGLLKKQKVSFFDKLVMAIQITDDLQFLHGLKIMHGDIALWNILVKVDLTNHHFVAHLNDLGLAYELGEELGYLSRHSGNVFYFPPEVVEYKFCLSERAITTHPSLWDTWALGMVLHQLLNKQLRLPWRYFPDGIENSAPLYAFSRLFKEGPEKLNEKKAVIEKYSTPITYDSGDLMQRLIYNMLSYEPQFRPPLSHVIETLIHLRNEVFAPSISWSICQIEAEESST